MNPAGALIVVLGLAFVVMCGIFCVFEDDYYIDIDDADIDAEIRYLMEIKRRNKEWREKKK